MAGTVLRIGMDDTDSPRGMCTTYLAYRAAAELERQGAEFEDYPRLVRLNPNIPWKTRGNGAVAMTVRTDRPDMARRAVERLVRRHSDTANGANPGLVFAEGPVPAQLRELAREALWRLVPRSRARRIAAEAGVDAVRLGNGQGLVGAMGAVGYEFGDCTAELIAYRKRSMFGAPRRISAESVQEVDRLPGTFNSYDGRILIAPHGPDPVFYGIRGEDPALLCRASAMVRSGERPAGHMIFRSNQGTGDHLQNRITDPEPHMSGTIRGAVCSAPRAVRGGHVMLAVRSGGLELPCAVYRQTGLASAAMALVPGDEVEAGGGIRRARPPHPRALNVELLRLVRPAAVYRMQNPSCGRCGKSMKSKGRGQGFECARCGASGGSRVKRRVPRGISRGTHLPRVSAHRHLSRPARRAGRANRIRFDATVPWLLKSSGE